LMANQDKVLDAIDLTGFDPSVSAWAAGAERVDVRFFADVQRLLRHR